MTSDTDSGSTANSGWAGEIERYQAGLHHAVETADRSLAAARRGLDVALRLREPARIAAAHSAVEQALEALRQRKAITARLLPIVNRELRGSMPWSSDQ